jgi:ATP-binding cassette subfamily F protein uup
LSLTITSHVYFFFLISSMRALSIQGITKHLGGKLLFENLSFTLTEGDRGALIGRNGYGKSTLLKIILGDLEPDEGEVVISPNLRVGSLAQHTDYSTFDGSILEAVERCGIDGAKANEALNLAGFVDLTAAASELSGGWQKRLAFATMLAQEPDFLVLDEPTNHLDFSGLRWLTKTLQRFSGGYLIVSHDRALLSQACDHFIELSHLGQFESEGTFEDYRKRRQEHITKLHNQHQKLKNIAKRETAWLRSGVKARTTKSKSRIDSAHDINAQTTRLGKALSSEKNVEFNFKTRLHLSRELLNSRDLSMPGRLIDIPDIQLTPGRKIGVVGPNGCGKSTLLQVLCGNIEPTAGTVLRGAGVQVSLFDQHKRTLDPSLTVEETFKESAQSISFGGQNYSIFTWAQRFSFEKEQLYSKVGELSGGEQSRLLLALVMSQPTDVLLLDEPTNDLDMFAIEALDEALVAFEGAVVVISHDRFLIDSVCTDVLGFTEYGKATLYGSFSQWENAVEIQSKPNVKTQKKNAPTKPKGLNYQQKKSLKALEKEIEKQELLLASLEQQLANPESTDHAIRIGQEYEAVTSRLEGLLDEWTELEALNTE